MNMVRDGVPESIDLCQGDPGFASDVMAFWLEKLNVCLGRYSEAKDFDVPRVVINGIAEDEL